MTRWTAQGRPRPILRATALGAALLVAPGFAEEAGSATDQEYDEEVVVVGIRGSLRQSLDRKRNAENFVDAITAEDIGAFPDQNLAESLQRVTGVGIDRQKGEGAFLTVRGLGPDFVQVTTNGRAQVSNVQTQASGDARNSNNNGSRIVGFNQYQSGLVQAVEVYKSPQANHYEGGLGGIVEVQTRRPIDIGRRVVSVSARAIHGELAGETDPSVFALFSDKFADDTLGFMISAEWDDRTLREDEVDITSFTPVERAYDLDGDGTREVMGFHPENVRAVYTEQERERMNVSAALQWRPNERVDVTWDLLYSEFDRETFLLRLPLRTNASIASGMVDVVQVNDGGTNVFSTFDTVNAVPRPFPWVATNEVESITTGLDLEFTVNDRLNVSFDLAIAQAENDGREILYLTEVGGRVQVRTEMTGKDAPAVTIGRDLSNPADFVTVGVGDRSQVLEDDELQFRADAEYTFPNSEFVESIEVGVSYRDRERNDYGRGVFATNWFGEPVIGVRPFPVSDFLTGIKTNFLTEWLNPDVHAAVDHFLVGRRDEIPQSRLDGLTERTASDIIYEEQITAAYVLANFSGQIGNTPFSGNFGIRYVDTETEATGLVQDVTGFVVISPTLANLIFSEPFLRGSTNSYAEVLPSLNLRFELRDDLILRAAAASVMSRPAFSSLNPGQGGSAVLRLISSGNPTLDPITADQADLALEWYFGDYAIASAGAFQKKAEGFVETGTTFRTLPEVIDPQTDEAVTLRVNQPLNGPDTTVKGFELAYQNTFANLPAPFDGLGVTLNYTFIDSAEDFLNQLTGTRFGILGLSENTYNVGVFYEKGRFSARIAYNHRDEFLEDLTDTRGHPILVDAYEQWDASVKYHLNDKVTLSLEAINLTDENVTLYHVVGTGSREWFNAEQNTGRRLFAGVRMQL